MVDKGIKSSGNQPRTALIVSQDSFRTKLLQSELSKYGFQTKVILPGDDAQGIAKQWGADVILGIKEATQIKIPQAGLSPIHDYSTKPPGPDMGKRIPPPFPPDKEGGAAGISQMSQPTIRQQDCDWGESYIPVLPKGGPGGVSTEDLARSFVDKGNWPVLTSFSLFYMAPFSGEEQK